MQLFLAFDIDGSGFLDVDELKLLLQHTLEKFNVNKEIEDYDIEYLLPLVDENNDGQVFFYLINNRFHLMN